LFESDKWRVDDPSGTWSGFPAAVEPTIVPIRKSSRCCVLTSGRGVVVTDGNESNTQPVEFRPQDRKVPIAVRSDERVPLDEYLPHGSKQHVLETTQLPTCEPSATRLMCSSS
jgi:hypothetical protein